MGLAHGLDHRLEVGVAHLSEFGVHIANDGLVITPGAFVLPDGFHLSDHPAVAAVELGVNQVTVGDVAVALVPPVRTPGVTDNEYLIGVRVANAEHGVATVGGAGSLGGGG